MTNEKKPLDRELLAWWMPLERHPLPWFSLDEREYSSVVVDCRGDTVAIVRSNTGHAISAARALAIGARLLFDHYKGKLTKEMLDQMVKEWEHGQRIIQIAEDIDPTGRAGIYVK